MKRAAIYVRVSTEAQSDKASPAEQEADCRAYCERNQYAVVNFYRDTERYKAKGKMVEPSGTRADRPGFKAMLADARKDNFDVIIAWREDRLYRGSRPMLDVQDILKETSVDIELVKETFNRQLMWVKAGFAEMELDGIKERITMGKQARLRDGKMHLSVPPYGYDYDPLSNGLVVNEEEAHWVRLMWQWFGEGIGRKEIQRRLIDGNAVQKKSTSADTRRKYLWSLNVINKILRRDCYATGLWSQKYGKVDGTKTPRMFGFTIPTIVDTGTLELVRRRRQQWENHPAGNWHSNAILAGFVYCQSCGCKMRATKKTKNGRQNYYYYTCNSKTRLTSSADCCKSIRQDEADLVVWCELWSLLTEPGRFEQAIQERMKQLQDEEANASTDIAAIERQLDGLMMERQRVIGLARKGIITDDDLSIQLLPLTVQEKALKRELEDRLMFMGNQAARLMELIDLLRVQVQSDLAQLHPDNTPGDEEQAREHFKTKRRFVEALIKRVVILPDKSYKIEMEVGLSPLEEFRDDSLLVGLLPSKLYALDVQTVSFTVNHVARA